MKMVIFIIIYIYFPIFRNKISIKIKGQFKINYIENLTEIFYNSIILMEILN